MNELDYCTLKFLDHIPLWSPACSDKIKLAHVQENHILDKIGLLRESMSDYPLDKPDADGNSGWVYCFKNIEKGTRRGEILDYVSFWSPMASNLKKLAQLNKTLNRTHKKISHEKKTNILD